MSEDRLVIEGITEKNRLLFHCSWEISHAPHLEFYHPFSRANMEVVKSGGETALTIFEGLSRIVGIEAINIWGYCVSVQKGVAFKWDSHLKVEIMTCIGSTSNNSYGVLYIDKTDRPWGKSLYGDLATLLNF